MRLGSHQLDELNPDARNDRARFTGRRRALFYTAGVVRALYEACRFEFAVLQGAAPWCAVFLPEALQLLEFRQDLKYYWRYGHGQAVNYQPSCLLLQDILSKFRLGAASCVVGSSENNTPTNFGQAKTTLRNLSSLPQIQ